MKRFLNFGPNTTVFDDDGKSVNYVRTSDTLAIGSDGSVVISNPAGNTFTVTKPDGQAEIFTQSPLGDGSAIGSNGTNIIGLGPSGGMITGQ